jgi:hypothetical protein
MKVVLATAAVAALLVALPAVGAPSPIGGAAQLITGRQIANSSITGKDVKNKSLTKGDFSGSVRGPRGAQGPAGPAGPQGARGPAGANGTNGFGVLSYPQAAETFASTDTGGFTADCPPGTYPTGGSAWAWDTATNAVDRSEVITSQGLAFDESGVGSGYFANVDNTVGEEVEVIIDVACANANQVSALTGGDRQRR